MTLAVGPSLTGKSVLCQHIAFGALQDGRGVAYYTSQLTPRRLESQMKSLGLNISDENRTNRFEVFPVQEPIIGEDSGHLLTALALDLDRLPSKYELIIVDAITNLASASQDYAVMGFLSTCKRICNKGRTIVVVAHSSAFSADLLGRAASVCEYFMKLATGKISGKVVRKVELLKVDDIEIDRDNIVAFEVEAERGINIIPFSQVKA